MWVLGLGTARTLNVACICTPLVSADERLLLDVIALHQHDRHLEAMMLLRSILAPRAALTACDSSKGLAAILATSGFWLASPKLPAIQHTALVADETGMAGGDALTRSAP